MSVYIMYILKQRTEYKKVIYRQFLSTKKKDEINKSIKNL